MPKPRRLLRKFLLWLLVAIALVAIGVYVTLHRSLPRLDGELPLHGLNAPAKVERDALGVVTVTATTRNDAYRALGFVHAQERYFEMDLMRRVAAGELSELFGPAALPADRRNRAHRFRRRAALAVAQLAPADRAALDAYVAGIHAGLADLGARSLPYLLLRQQPQAWRAEDSALVIYAMFLDLNGGTNSRELDLARMRALLPPSLYTLLTAAGTSWDAPLIGTAVADPPLPPATDVDLRKLDPGLFGKGVALGGDLGIGSNNFAVSGALTTTGAAMVANDMHLGLRVPNIWFRARIKYDKDEQGRGPVDVSGATLPGVPAVVAGSNGHIAWGYTNTYGDWMDWVRVHWAAPEHRVYRGAQGDVLTTRTRETIKVAGAPAESLVVEETEFGTVLAQESDAVGLALNWIAYHPEALNFNMSELETAADVPQALDIANRSGIPPQNFVVGDRDGRIAWTVIGAIPRRRGFDPSVPADFDAPGTGWMGWLTPSEYPRLVSPPSNRLWSANARTMDGQALATIGDGGYALGARAGQIRDDLFAHDRFEPKDLLAIQLDDRSVFLKRWWELLRQTLVSAKDPTLAQLDSLTQHWDERAVPEAVAYRLVRAFRLYVNETVLDGLGAPGRVRDAQFRLPALGQAEGIVWKLVQERPEHLLPPRFADWDALLAAAAHRVVDELGKQPGGLGSRTWAERNTTQVRHPLSKAVPMLGWLLDMPARALPGDSAMPRVQGVEFGASERFAVSPGHEDQGYFHMPGGQSGHPLSPFYGAGHHDWEEGKATPFLPGNTEYTLSLAPN